MKEMDCRFRTQLPLRGSFKNRFEPVGLVFKSLNLKNTSTSGLVQKAELPRKAKLGKQST